MAGRANYVVYAIGWDYDPAHGNAQWYRGTQILYNNVGQVALSRLIKWQYDGEGDVVRETPLAEMEYRYDSGRQRYLVRPRSAVTNLPYAAHDGAWSDYAGEGIYDDHTLTPDGTAVNTASHVPGLAEYDASSTVTKYLHGNLIGSNDVVSDQSSGVSARRVFTAFGEPVYENCGTGVPPVCSRYGYAGAWGYQRGNWDGAAGACDSGNGSPACDPLAALGWLHVGERYYDPASGRFVQRDPIGIAGGFNTYVYVLNLPTRGVDPTGEGFWDGDNWFHDWVARNVWMNAPVVSDRLATMSDAEAYGWGVGGSAFIGGGGYLVGTFVASGGAYTTLCVTTYRGGLHFVIYGSGGAGWWHFYDAGESAIGAIPGGIPIFALPMRYPEAILKVTGIGNCLISALRGMIAMW